MSKQPHWQKFKGRRSLDGPTFIQLFHHIIDTDEFAAIPGSALKLLLDIAREYRPGKNGDISFDDIRKHNPRKWTSRSTRTAAVKYLEDHGWIIRTRRGGLGMGCDLFAVTWWPIDECGGKHDYPAETTPSNLWKTKTLPDRNPVQAVPKSGTKTENAGSESGTAGPESGPKHDLPEAA